MKFITTIHLNRWADTKECQQLLPELVKKLIDASVSNIDRLSFPSGNSVNLPGWDGIVLCEESIDLVPEGVSLWECGATENVKGKLEDDFAKRNGNTLGYAKNSSTFVFVTPRIWTGADEWVRNHQTGWKKVVVYTAVELERWIERNPTVGMWLAEKLRILLSGGYSLPERYWEKWAQGKNISLPYQIILSGREAISQKIINACEEPSLLVLRALSQDECIAFAVASILSCDKSHLLNARMVVVTDKCAFEDLVNHYDNLIVLTTLTEDFQYAVKRGHSVIVASTPADQIKNAVVLPTIKKEGFISALVDAGINEIDARRIAKDTTRDVNILRRRLDISIEKPKWAESTELAELLPAFLVGRWNDDLKGDRELLEFLSGKSYEQYELSLSSHLLEENTPLIHVGGIWRIRSPYEVMYYAKNILTDSILAKYREICLRLIQDDEPDAVEELKSDIFHFWSFKQKFSSAIKNGVYQNFILLSMENNDGGRLSQWVDETLKKLFDNWDLARFLSNRRYIEILAEASPQTFLCLMENLPENVTIEIFTPRKKQISLTDNIYYAETLCSLEMLAWNEEYLNRVTKLLLRYSKYKNESNYVNKPINSLLNIYRLYEPQTYVTFADRMTLLKANSSEYKEIIFKLCVKICESLRMGWYHNNSYYRWRMFGFSEPVSSDVIEINDVDVVVRLMLQCCVPTADNFSKIIELSFNQNVGGCSKLIVDFVRTHTNDIDDKQFVANSLRDEIHHYISYPNSCPNLSSAELDMYKALLDELEPKDVLHKYLWLFEKMYVQLPCEQIDDFDYEKDELELLNYRIKVIQNIIDLHGEDGVWSLINTVKCPESVAESIVSIFKESLCKSVCQKYKSNLVSEKFVQAYFRILFYKNIEVYLELAKQLIENDRDLTIVLYAPRYNKKLAEMANGFGRDIKEKYWISVDVHFTKLDDSANVVRELVNVGRFPDAISIISNNLDSIQMSELEIVRIIMGSITNCKVPFAHIDTHALKKILNRLDESEDTEVVNLLVKIEFYLYKILEHQKNMNKSRFAIELTRDPSLMIQLVEFAYKSDDENDERLESLPLENRKIMADISWHILHHGCSLIPGINNEGVLDEAILSNYIDQLYDLSRQKKRTIATDFIVGFMLGDIFCYENCPIDVLGKIVEKLNNDVVDEHFVTRILNSRGLVCRAYNEGGNQERKLVAKFEKIKKQTQLLYPRMTRMLDTLINRYKKDATQEDDNAYMTDLEF